VRRAERSQSSQGNVIMSDPLKSLTKDAPESIKKYVGTLVIGVLLGGGLVWLVDSAARDDANDRKKTESELRGQITQLTDQRDKLLSDRKGLVDKAELDRVSNELYELKSSLDDLKTPVSTYQTVDNRWCPWANKNICFVPHLINEAGVNPHYYWSFPFPLDISIPGVWDKPVKFSREVISEQFNWNGKAYLLVTDLRPFYEQPDSTRFGMCVEAMPQGGVEKGDGVYKCFPQSAD